MKIIITTGIFFLIICISNIAAQQLSGSFQLDRGNYHISSYNDYDRFQCNDCSFSGEPGEPELPVYSRQYMIPENAVNINLSVNVSKQKLDGNYYLYPVQPPVIDGETEEPLFVAPNNEIYGSTISFPGKQAAITSDRFYLGYRIITIQFYPFEYIPRNRELYACRIEYTVSYDPGESSDNKSVLKSQSPIRYERNKKAVKFLVKNPDDVDGFENFVQIKFASTLNMEISNHILTTPDYIIITCDSLKQTFQRLADWKNRKGVLTVIQTVETINNDYQGSDLSEKIRNYIIDRSNVWNNGLYILLGGGTKIIPPRMVKSVDKPTMHPADMYYATTVGTWNYNRNNVFKESADSVDYSLNNIVGRIPVDNTKEANVVIDKIILYEKAKNIEQLNYVRNNLYAIAYMEKEKDKYNNYYLTDFFHKQIKDSNDVYIPSYINNKYICDNADCSPNLGAWYRSACLGADMELNRSNFLSVLSSGGNMGVGKFHFIFHKDHAAAQNIATSNHDKGEKVRNLDIDQLSNGTSYQIMLTGSCNPADFAYDCIGKHYLTNPNGGGVAFIGNTDVGWRNEYYILKLFSDAIYDTPGHPSMGRYDIGSAYQYIIKKQATNNWRLHLLGDPEMQMWTDTPLALNANVFIPSTAGENFIDITINNLPNGKKATVCIYKENEVHEVMELGNGAHSYLVTYRTAGTVYVTITGHNIIPYEKSVSVSVPSDMEFVDIKEIIINDSNFGNGNGKIEAGETIEMSVKLQNASSALISDVSATLSSSSPYIKTIINNGSEYGDVGNAGQVSLTPYKFTVDENAPELLKDHINSVKFTLNLNYEPYYIPFAIDLFAPKIELGNKTIVSMNTRSTVTDVQIKIDLTNIGNGDATGLSARLLSNSSHVTGCVSTWIPFPDISKNETKSNLGTFLFSVYNTYLNTSPLPPLEFQLEVKNRYGRTWLFPFDLAKNPAQVQVGNIKFISDVTEIELFWPHQKDAEKGYNIYRKNVDPAGNPVGNPVKINQYPVVAAYIKDRGLSELTKYAYQVTAVSSSGTESALSDPLIAWTSYGSTGLFPITMTEVGDAYRMMAPVNVEDVDNDGKKEIFTAITAADKKGFLIGLDSGGNELFDIDNNITSFSGFARFNAGIESPVAIGDLYATGENQIVSVTRDLSSTKKNYITCHSVKDTNNDHLPDILWQIETPLSFIQGPVIANMDNSSDGSKEIVLKPDGNSAGLTDSEKIQILDNNGNLLYKFGPESTDHPYNYAAVAVADLDGDGDKEVIAGYKNGVYIWHHDGTPYANSGLIYSKSGYQFLSSPVICDIDDDGEKEIVIVATQNSSRAAVICAVKTNGNPVPGWGTTSQGITVSNIFSFNRDLSQGIVVGDLNNDGKLEVVAVHDGELRVWKNDGSKMLYVPIAGIEGTLKSPILADVDNNPNDIEILMHSSTEDKLYGMKVDGTNVLGFPLRVDQSFDRSTPCVADVDGDGKNEVVAAVGKMIYMWKTDGRSDRIEWGSYRHDSQNTGEYYKSCQKIIINSDMEFTDGHVDICNDVIVESGTVTIRPSCLISMNKTAMIIVRPGATLIIDGSTILNANIKALPQSTVVLKNNGYVQLRKSGAFNIEPGATFNYQLGTIDISQ